MHDVKTSAASLPHVAVATKCTRVGEATGSRSLILAAVLAEGSKQILANRFDEIPRVGNIAGG